MAIGGFKKGGVAGAVLSLALPLTAHYEGLELKAYLDPVGIPTICYGETHDVAIGDVKSREECDEMFTWKMAYYGWQVRDRVDVQMPPETHAALVSFAYNVGIGNFERSTLLKKLNAGDVRGACNELPRWVYAKGIKLNGLIKRREAERKLCLKGLTNEVDYAETR